MKRLLVLAAVLASLVVVGVPLYVLNAHPVSESALAELTIGMSHRDVEAVLGKATKIETSPQGGQQWRYSGITWCIVWLDFSSDGLLVEITHDH